MKPAVLDEASFDRFLSDNEIAVVGFVGQDADAVQFGALVDAVAGSRAGVAFAQIQSQSRALFELFGLDGTATAIFRRRIGMYLEPGLPVAQVLERLLIGIAALNMERVQKELEQQKAAQKSLAVHRVCPASRRGKL